MKYKFLFLSAVFVFFRFFANVGFSQDFGDGSIKYNHSSIPPAPNAAALGKYGEIPIDKANGNLNLSIPLYEIEEHDIKLPLSISYHSSGLKVGEYESWIGMGWVLNAGGAVTRVVKGKPDDEYYGNGFFENASIIPDADKLRQRMSTVTGNDLVALFDTLRYYSEDNLDFEPDIFYINAGGLSLTGFFDNNLQFHTVPETNIKVIPYIGYRQIFAFRVIDENGLDYYFDICEETDDSKGGGFPYYSSWYLSKIKNPLSNSEITFIYVPCGSSITSINEKATYDRTISGGDWENENLAPKSIVVQGTNGFILNSITSSTDSISFTNDTLENYNDTLETTCKYITGMYIFRNDSIYKQYNFIYKTITNDGRNRLFLKELQEGNAGSILNSHKFGYNSIKLPRQYSLKQDYWGYYNNGDNTTSILPIMTYEDHSFGYAHREPDSTYAQAGILDTVFYPTGGYTRFVYELNAYGKPTNREDIKQSDESEIPSCTNTSGDVKTCEGNLPFSPNYYEYWNFVLSAETTASDTSNPNISKCKVRIFDESGQLVKCLTCKYGTVSKPVDLNPSEHEYTLKTTVWSTGITIQPRLTFNLCQISLLNDSIEEKSGGLRIKQIINYDPVTNTNEYKTYDYEKSGYEVYGHDNYFELMTAWVGPNYEQKVEKLRMFLAGRSIALGSGGNPIAYTKVTEYNGTKENNSGKTETFFMRCPDDVYGISIWSNIFSNSGKRSLIEKEKVYKNIGFGYELVQETNYFYNYLDRNHDVTGFKAIRVIDVKDWVPNYADLNEFEVTNFSLSTYCLVLDSIAKKNYYPDKSVTASIKYVYDSQKHNRPTSIRTYESDGSISTQKNKYSFDYTGSEPAIYLLEGLNNNILIEQEDTKMASWGQNEKPIEHIKNNFKSYSTEQNYRIVLTSIQKSTTDQSFIYDIIYDSVGINNNVLQYRKSENSVIISLIWDSKNVNIIASITNATYNNVFYTSFEEDGTEVVGTVAKTGSKVKTGGFSINNIMVPDSTVDLVMSYWYLDGSTWKFSGLIPFDPDFSETRTIDEFRILPKNAVMTTYSYNPWNLLSSKTDENNLTTYYEYNSFGQLKRILDQDRNLIKEFKYHYQNQTSDPE